MKKKNNYYIIYMNYLIYVYTLHIEEVDNNKNSNTSLIYGCVKLNSKSKK